MWEWCLCVLKTKLSDSHFLLELTTWDPLCSLPSQLLSALLRRSEGGWEARKVVMSRKDSVVCNWLTSRSIWECKELASLLALLCSVGNGGCRDAQSSLLLCLLSRDWSCVIPLLPPHSNHRTVLVQLLLNEPRTAESGESSASSSDIHMGDPDGFLGCCLQPGPALVFVDIWGVKLLDGRFFSFVSFSFNLPFK